MSLPVAVYTQGSGTASIIPPVTLAVAPAANLVHYPVGQIALVPSINAVYILENFSAAAGVVSANWVLLASGAGAIESITTQDSSVVVPVADNINLSGAANELTTTGSGSTATVALVNAVIAPGSITTTTFLAAGSTVTGGTGVVATTGNVSATAGAVNAGTSITATSGDITATNGNFVASAAASGLVLPVALGSAASPGPVTCNGRVGSVTFTGPSIAGGAVLALTVSNSAIAGSGTVVLYDMRGATTGAAINIQSVVNSAGSSVITVNNGTGATTQADDLTFDFIVLN